MDSIKISVHVKVIGDHHLLMRVNDQWSLFDMREVDKKLLDEDIQRLKQKLMEGQ
jgi:hypothetical protein